MGVDIYMSVEKRDNKEWVLVDTDALDIRNYALFTILGMNARKGYEKLKQIAANRQMPNDVSTGFKHYFESCGCHPVRYLYLAEILDFNWDQMAPLGIAKHYGRTYRDIVGTFLTEFVQEFLECGDPNDIRLLFWLS